MTEKEDLLYLKIKIQEILKETIGVGSFSVLNLIKKLSDKIDELNKVDFETHFEDLDKIKKEISESKQKAELIFKEFQKHEKKIEILAITLESIEEVVCSLLKVL